MSNWNRLLPKSRTKQVVCAAVLLGGSALLFTYYHDLWELLSRTDETHPTALWVVIVQVLFGGVLAGVFASVVGALIVGRIQTQPVWAKDIAEVNSTVQDLATRVTELAELTAKLRTDHTTLLKRLPDAIGRGFTHSLFSYYPRTSASIADMLSAKTDSIYQQHYDRIIVTEGVDTYKILQLVEKTFDGKPRLLWRVHFRIYWTWLNDSQVTRYPLQNFMILLSAPQDIAKPFQARSEAEKKIEEDAYYKLLRSGNYVRSFIAHPTEPTRRVSLPDVEALFLVEGVTISAQGKKPIPIDKSALVPMEPEELPGRLCAGYRIPEAVGVCPIASWRFDGDSWFHRLPGLPFPSNRLAFRWVVEMGFEHPQLLVAHDPSERLLRLNQRRGHPAQHHGTIRPTSHSTGSPTNPGVRRLDHVRRA